MPRLIRALVVVLMLTGLFPEAKLGLQGLILVIPFQYRGPELNRPFVFELVIIAIAVLFVVGLLNREIDWRPTWWTTAGLRLLYVALLAIPLSMLFGFQLTPLAFARIRIVLGSLALFLVVSHLSWSPRQIRVIAWLLIGVAVFHSLLVVFEHWLPGLSPIRTNVIAARHYVRHMSLFTQPSRLALLLGIGFAALAQFLISQTVSAFEGLACAVLLLLLGAALFLSHTRSVVAAVPVSLLLVALVRRDSTVWKQVAGIAGLLLLVMIVFRFTGILAAFGARFIADAISDGLLAQVRAARYARWFGAILLLLRYPLGIGYGAHPVVGHPHSDPIQWLTMFGFPGLVLFLCFVAGMYRQAACFAAEGGSEIEGLSALLSAITVFLTAGVVSTVYLVTPVAFWFWLLSGVLVSYSCRLREGQHHGFA